MVDRELRKSRKKKTDREKLSLIKKSPSAVLKNQLGVTDRKTLKAALSHLKRLISKRQVKDNCKLENSSEARTDHQIKLRCRQLPNVVHELRKAITRQDWDETATLLMVLCHPGLKLYSSVIIRTCYLLLFNHPNSSLKLLRSFVGLTTGYILEEDVNKYIKILFALRNSALSILDSGKYIKSTSDYKVTRDVEFENL